jgi:hypothetical protein
VRGDQLRNALGNAAGAGFLSRGLRRPETVGVRRNKRHRRALSVSPYIGSSINRRCVGAELSVDN